MTNATMGIFHSISCSQKLDTAEWRKGIISIFRLIFFVFKNEVMFRVREKLGEGQHLLLFFFC